MPNSFKWNGIYFKLTSDEIPSLGNLQVEGTRFNSGFVGVSKVSIYVDQFFDFVDITNESLKHEGELSKIRESIEEWHSEQLNKPLPKKDPMSGAKRFMELEV